MKVNEHQSELQWSKDMNEYLKAGTQYSGSRGPEEKVFSISSLGKPLFQNLMQYHYGTIAEDKPIGSSYLGSAYERGWAEILKEQATLAGEPDRYVFSKRLKHKLSNGWEISGEWDVFDTKYNIFVDSKVISDTAYKQIIKNDKLHNYNMQQAGYRWSYSKEYPDLPLPDASLHIINKGGKAAKETVVVNFDLVLLEPDEIEYLLLERTNAIQEYIDKDQLPSGYYDKMENTKVCNPFAYGKDTCRLYCSYNKVCPTYNKSIDWAKRKELISCKPKPEFKTEALPGFEMNGKIDY